MKTWIAATNEGTIITAHCNRMAGLGGRCSHVAAILFTVEAEVRMKRSKLCTSVPCKWLMPTAVTNIPYQELKHIDFTSSRTKKKKLDAQISELSAPLRQQGTESTKSTSNAQSEYYSPAQANIQKFFKALNKSNTHPAILSLISPYSSNYKPKADDLDVPEPLAGLYDSELCNLDFNGHYTRAVSVS